MVVQVRESTIEEMEEKLDSINTALNKIGYLESALKSAIASSFEVKRFIWGELARLYEEQKMFDRAARALGNLAGMEPMFRESVDSYVMAAEMFCRIGKVDDADEMFIKAVRDAKENDRVKIKLARKNIYLKMANELERKGKRASAVKFYEKLIKMRLDDFEKEEIKDKLVEMYKALGMFREAKLL